MRVLLASRGTPEFRQAHVGRVTPSDTAALIARPESKRYRSLIDRLVLDLELGATHTTEHPDPWVIEHEAMIASALACYRREFRECDVRPVGFVVHDEMSWLGASPVAIVDGNCCLLVLAHKTLRGYRSEPSGRALRARAQLLMFVCGVTRCDVVRHLDRGGVVPDKMRTSMIFAEPEWAAANLLPRIVSLWSDVVVALGKRGTLQSVQSRGTADCDGRCQVPDLTSQCPPISGGSCGSSPPQQEPIATREEPQ